MATPDDCTDGPQPSRPDPGRPERHPTRGGYPSGARPASHLPPPLTGVSPIDPTTPLEEVYVFLHEQYTAAQAAGFAEDRAFQLAMMLLNHALDQPPSP